MTSRSGVLRRKLELVRPMLMAATGRMWTMEPVAERYAEYLCVMHGVIRASVPLMAAAVQRCDELAAAPVADPVAAPLASYLRRHIGEERGHDEWLLADLAAIGHDPDEPLRRLPAPPVAAMVGAQYYWIAHHHPICLLGYIAVLEGYPPMPGLVDSLLASTGHPRAGFHTLARHATLDVRHRDDLLRIIDDLPLTAELTAALDLSALQTIAAAAGVVGHITTVRPRVPRSPGSRRTGATRRPDAA